MPNDDPVVRDALVPVPIDRAFEGFTREIGAWWPAAFTFAGDALAAVVVDGRAGGRVYERSADGTEVDWGAVRAWDPPRRFVFAWRVGADRGQEPPERASEVEVRFEPADATGDGATGETADGERTLVTVRHSDFARHGDGAGTMRAGMASAQGWQALLDLYRRHLT